jgi:hypothetical protein
MGGVGGVLNRLYDVSVTYGIGSPSNDLRKLLNLIRLWWAQQDSNLRLPPCEGGTLPLSYAPGVASEDCDGLSLQALCSE